jgi:hypothetical protein
VITKHSIGKEIMEVVMDRRELKIEGQYIRIRCTGEIFKVKVMIVHGEEKGQYYITDEGNEVLSSECFAIQIPSFKDYNDVLKKYPKAIIQKGINEVQNRTLTQALIAKLYSESQKLSLLEELKSYKQRCREIEKALGIE